MGLETVLNELNSGKIYKSDPHPQTHPILMKKGIAVELVRHGKVYQEEQWIEIQERGLGNSFLRHKQYTFPNKCKPDFIVSFIVCLQA